MRAGVALAALGLLSMIGPERAAAQSQIELLRDRPLIVNIAEPSISQYPVPALTPDRIDRLHRAEDFANQGRIDKASEALGALLREIPHHAMVVTQLARVYLAKKDYAALERFARSERQSQRDTLLAGREYSIALERLGRPRDAAQVAIDMWCVAPQVGEWASAVVGRLAPTDPKGIREAMRRAVQRYPRRTDLAIGAAGLEWKLGDAQAALRALDVAADPSGAGVNLPWAFAEGLLRAGTARDSAGAIDALLKIAGDSNREPQVRLASARRAWDVIRARLAEREGAPRVAQALKGVPADQWPPELRIGVARGLRQAGMTTEARALVETLNGPGGSPELALEQALNDLRDGPPARVLPTLRSLAPNGPEARYRYAEALFFAGECDSALAWYQRIAEDPDGAYSGAALERIYLIEDGNPREAVHVFGRVAYEDWRGNPKAAMALQDSLYRSLSRGPLWAHAAIQLSARREVSGDVRGALEPLLALADSLPGDRLASLARQRAGDIYLTRLKDDASAVTQYEECLARYPRAWNAAEVRRKLEVLRREKRF